MIGELLRYNLAGVINTVLGYAIIFLLMSIGAGVYISNIAGYTVGIIMSFFLNKFFVFRSKSGASREMVRFLAGFAVSYVANIMTVYVMVNSGSNAYLAQIMGGIAYFISMFLISKLWVFSYPKKHETDSGL